VDGSVAAEVAVRGVVQRDLLRRLGAHRDDVAAGTLAVGDWLVAADRADEMRDALLRAVRESGAEGISLGAAARAAGAPDPTVAAALLTSDPSCVVEGGRARVRTVTLPQRWAAAAETLAADFATDPLAAPDTDRLRRLGLDAAALVALARHGLVLRVSETVVLGPDADVVALARLAELPQPFTVSEARRALGSTRRVVLPLLAHLDRTGRTARLPDDTRRLR